MYVSVFVIVQPVDRSSVWVIELVALASEFSNVGGVNPVNCRWLRSKENRLRAESPRASASSAKALPMARSLVLRSKRRAHAYLSGFVLFPNPVAFPDAKFTPEMS